MASAKILRIYLDEIPLIRAEKGNFNIVNRIRTAFERYGFRVQLCKNSDAERLKSATRRGYSLFHMDDPFHPRALTMRKAYFYPFWRIEASAKRWEWPIARSVFVPGDVDADLASAFCNTWRRKLFPNTDFTTQSDGFVYIPLQGRLLEHRSFQFSSPLDMIRSTLLHDPNRDVIVGLHPGETYLQDETDAIKSLLDDHPRLLLSSAPMHSLLSRCDYVVTENSSVAFSGYFLHKPAVLFAKIDFHHIAACVGDIGVERAIDEAPTLAPDYDRYIYWFLQMTAINGGAPNAEDRILESVRRCGWDV